MIKFYRGLKDSYSIAAHGSDIYFATDTLEILHGGNSYSGLNKDKTIKDIGFTNEILTITYTDGSTSELDSNLVTKTELSNKVDKVSGKQLSSNDFTNELKTKLENSNVYKHQFRALSALPDNGDGWYSIASIGDTESSIVQISSGGHTDVQVAINTGWAGNTTGSLTVLNSFIDDTNGNHAFVKAVRLRKIPNSNNGTAVLEAKINRTGYYTYTLYVNIVVSVFTNAGHNIITTNSEHAQTLQLVNDDSNVIQEFTLTDKAIMAKNIVAETVNADNIIENIVVNGKTYPAAKTLDLGNILSEGLTISGAIINGGDDSKSITSNSLIISSDSGLYLSSNNGVPVLELGPLLGYKDWQIKVGSGLTRDGKTINADFEAIIGTDGNSYFQFNNSERYIELIDGKLHLDLSKLVGSGGSGGSGTLIGTELDASRTATRVNFLPKFWDVDGASDEFTMEPRFRIATDLRIAWDFGNYAVGTLVIPPNNLKHLEGGSYELIVEGGSSGGGVLFVGSNVEEEKVYNELYIGDPDDYITNNPLYLSSNSVLGIKRELLIGTGPNSMIQVPDNMVESYDNIYIKLKMLEGSGSSVAVADNGGLVLNNGELWLSTDIIGDQYDYQIKIGSGLDAGNNAIRVSPRFIIGDNADCSIIVPSENYTRDDEGKAHLIFNTGISKDELNSAIDARLKELGLIE